MTGDVCYSAGWAQGQLSAIARQRIPGLAAGQLSNENILLLDAVPAELPYVQDIIALSPATPNSHVAILANAYKQPFVFLQPSRTNEVLKLRGREITLVARVTPLGNILRLIDLEGQIDDRARGESAAMKSPPPLSIASKQPHVT